MNDEKFVDSFGENKSQFLRVKLKKSEKIQHEFEIKIHLRKKCNNGYK